MVDIKTIINVALGAIVAAAIIFAAWFVLDTRQAAAQNAAAVDEIVNFINSQLEQGAAAAQQNAQGMPQGGMQDMQPIQ